MKREIIRLVAGIYEIPGMPVYLLDITNHNQPRLYNLKTKCYLYGSIRRDGYRKVGVSIEGKYKAVFLHRVIASVWKKMSYWDLPKDLEIDHTDGNRLNNNVSPTESNLAWVTHKDNMNNPITRKTISEGVTKTVLLVGKDMKVERCFSSSREAFSFQFPTSRLLTTPAIVGKLGLITNSSYDYTGEETFIYTKNYIWKLASERVFLGRSEVKARWESLEPLLFEKDKFKMKREIELIKEFIEETV